MAVQETSRSRRAMRVPLSDSIAIAVARLVDDARTERRDPSHSDIGDQIQRAGLGTADPLARGQHVGKAKRVRAVLLWAIEHDPSSGGRLVAGLVDHIRGCGGFRGDSPNFVGEEAWRDAADALRAEGYELSSNGDLRPVVLDSLAGRELTDALAAYVRRARQGASDAALVTGTGKDLVEAVAGHVLVERGGQRPRTTFPALLGQAFVAVELATPEDGAGRGGQPKDQLDRALYEAACAVNRMRNADGTGHGRPWPPSLTEEEARFATQVMGLVATRLLDALSQAQNPRDRAATPFART